MPHGPTATRLMRLLWPVAVALYALTLTMWALASPVGSSPDEDFHLGSIWCGLGEREGLCEAGSSQSSREVPIEIPRDTNCYFGDQTKSAGCIDGFPAADGALMETERVNVDGMYPPVFYAAMSVFAGPDIYASVIVMRLVNVVLFLGLVTATAVLVPRSLRSPLVLPYVVTSVPLSLFLVPSINPSSWTIAAAGVVWVAFYGYLQSTGRRKWALAGLTVIATIMGAGSRADSAAFIAGSLVLVLILHLGRRRGWLNALLGVAMIVICAIFYLGSTQVDATSGGLPGSEPRSLTFSEILDNIVNVPDLWVGFLGGWPLGWFDTPMPAIVWVAAGFTVSGVVFLGIREMWARKAVALAGALFALWAVPTVLLVQSGTFVGHFVQPRYILPLGILLVGLALLTRAARPSGASLSAAQAVVVVGALAIAQAVALHTNIERYTRGLGDGWNLDAHVEWWSQGVLSPNTTWIVGSTAFAAALALTFVALRRSGPQGAEDPGGASEPPESAHSESGRLISRDPEHPDDSSTSEDITLDRSRSAGS